MDCILYAGSILKRIMSRDIELQLNSQKSLGRHHVTARRMKELFDSPLPPKAAIIRAMYFVNTHDKAKRLGKCSPSICPTDTIIRFLTLALVKFCDLRFSARYIIS